MKKIPEPSKRRLITLSQLLSQQDKAKITSTELSSLTGWTEATIRRDISLLELHNGVSNGYDTKILQKAICDLYQISSGLTEKHRCCIVGLGKLGEALLEDSNFEGSAFELVAGFDTNLNKIEIMKSNIPLFATLDLERKIRSLKIEYAILSVPDNKAQFMTDRLVSYGIKGIVNYTHTVISVPKGILVAHINTIITLAGMIAPSAAFS
ncbi:MAG: redox-sensing transcriptional repressor Rex [Treponema sp.]|nr:redox-sensing transcriptional repressor Rex [Treponema sp.]